MLAGFFVQPWMEPQLPSLDPCHLEAGKKITADPDLLGFVGPAKQQYLQIWILYVHIVSTARHLRHCNIVYHDTISTIMYNRYNALKYCHLCFVPRWRNSLLVHQILTTVHETIVNGFWTLHLIQHFAGSRDLHLPQPNKLQKKVPLAHLWSFTCKDPTLGTSKPYYQKRVWEKNGCWPPASPCSDEPQRSSRAIDAALTQDPGGRTIAAKNRPWPNVGTQGVGVWLFSIWTWVITCSNTTGTHEIVEPRILKAEHNWYWLDQSPSIMSREYGMSSRWWYTLSLVV